MKNCYSKNKKFFRLYRDEGTLHSCIHQYLNRTSTLLSTIKKKKKRKPKTRASSIISTHLPFLSHEKNLE